MIKWAITEEEEEEVKEEGSGLQGWAVYLGQDYISYMVWLYKEDEQGDWYDHVFSMTKFNSLTYLRKVWLKIHQQQDDLIEKYGDMSYITSYEL